MFLRRAVPVLARGGLLRPAISRSFASSIRRYDDKGHAVTTSGDGNKEMRKFEDIRTEADLLPTGGAAPGTVPTDVEQATGLERLEILGKMQGVDIFDMRPLDSSRKGTLTDPIVVKSFGDEQYLGCTGCPADSHVVIWLTTSRERPVERCPECGSVYRMEYVGPPDDAHGHGHHDDHAVKDPMLNARGESKTFADFVRPEYKY